MVPFDSHTFAWLATLFCVYFAAKCAKTFLSNYPRLFTAMAMLALAWALLLPYYSDDITSELLPAYGGFLLVYIGGILTLEAKARDSDELQLTVSRYQQLGLWLFLFIAAPSAVFAIKNQQGMPLFSLTTIQMELLVGTLLTILGYLSVTYGCKALFGVRVFKMFAFIFIFYGIAEVAFTYWRFTQLGNSAPMPPLFLCLFAGMKIVITVLLGYHVSRVAFTEQELANPIRTFVFKLLPFMGKPA